MFFSVPTNTCSFLIFGFQPGWSLCGPGIPWWNIPCRFPIEEKINSAFPKCFFLSPPSFSPALLPPPFFLPSFLSFHKYLLISFQTLKFPKHNLCQYNSSPGHSGIRHRDTTSYLQMKHALVLPYLGCRIHKTTQAWEGIFRAVSKRLNEL